MWKESHMWPSALDQKKEKVEQLKLCSVLRFHDIYIYIVSISEEIRADILKLDSKASSANTLSETIQPSSAICQLERHQQTHARTQKKITWKYKLRT